MDFNRIDEDRDINHHGKTINIGAEGEECKVKHIDGYTKYSNPALRGLE